MSDRLTDERLAEIETFGMMNAHDIKRWLGSVESLAIVAELRERRASDLTDEERKVLEAVLVDVREFGVLAPGRDGMNSDDMEAADAECRTRAIAALSRLLGGGR